MLYLLTVISELYTLQLSLSHFYKTINDTLFVHVKVIFCSSHNITLDKVISVIRRRKFWREKIGGNGKKYYLYFFDRTFILP